jgi:hypothetical protein
MTSHRFGLDGFAAERVGDENGLPARKSDAVATMTDVIDDEMFSHGARR